MENLEFLEEIGKLKDVKRTGWEIHKVKEPESVSDHSFRLALMAMIYSEEAGFDENKLIKMALLHDIHEIYTDDIPTRPPEKMTISFEERKKIHEEAIERISKIIPVQNKEIVELWNELSENKTAEAQFLNDLDKVEMTLQALQYKKEKRTTEDLEEFFETSGPRMKTEKGKELWGKIRKEYLNEL